MFIELDNCMCSLHKGILDRLTEQYPEESSKIPKPSEMHRMSTLANFKKSDIKQKVKAILNQVILSLIIQPDFGIGRIF